MSHISEKVSGEVREGGKGSIIRNVVKRAAPGEGKILELTNLSGSQVKEVEMGEDLKDVDMTSFNFMGNTKHTIPAYVNIVSISRQFHSFIDRKPEFKSQIHIVRGSPMYTMFVLPASGGIGSNFSVSNLEYLKPGQKRNSLYAEFSGGVMIEVQFKHPEHYVFFKKILTELLRLKKDSLDENRKPTVSMTGFEASQICEYRVSHQKQGGLSGKVAFLSGGGPTGVSDNRPQFYTVKSDEWMPNHVADWLSHIYLQPRGLRKIISVYEYMKSKNFFADFIIYFEMDSGTMLSLLKDIGRFLKDKSKCNPRLHKCLEDRVLLRALRRGCMNLRQRNGFFNIHFALVLRKRMMQIKRFIETGMYTLQDITQDLNYGKRYWWSVEDCRDYILSLLLFRKEFNKFVQELETSFQETLKEKFEKEVNILTTWDSDEKHLIIQSTDWSELLETFNESKLGEGMKLENVSFMVHVMNEQNKLRKQREEYIEANLEESEDIISLQSEVNRLDGSYTTTEKRVKMIQDRIVNMVKKSGKTDMSSPAILKLEKVLETTKKKLIDIRSTQFHLYESLKKRRTQEIKSFTAEDTYLQDVEMQILSKTPIAEDDNLSDFMESTRRRKIIRKFLQDKIVQIGQESGVKEFTVKLVISILRNHAPAAWQRKLLGTLDKFWTPSFCRWGFIHANCQISNLGCHWFSNDLVMVSDLSVGRQYEELLAIDCNCPLLLNVHTIYERITKLAERIVSANINYKYCLVNTLRKPGHVNCQEFTDEMIQSLDKTDFFPVVKAYLALLKSDLMKEEKQKALNMRYLDLTTIHAAGGQHDFKKKFAKVLVVMDQRFWKFQHFLLEKYKMEEKKQQEQQKQQQKRQKSKKKKLEKFDIKKVKHNKSRIYFNTHEDVDEFYLECIEIDPDFELNYPGVHQLIKAFDRSFWMRSSVGEDEKEIIKPGKRGCPFTYIMSQEPKQEDIKVDEKEKMEEQEEVEGED